MIKRFAIFLGVIAINCNVHAVDAKYVTPEFNDKNSHVSMVFICAVIGEKGGFDAEALPAVAKSSAKMGVPAKKAGELMADALTWWETNHEQYDITGMWEGSCREPLNNMRRMHVDQ